MSNKYYFHDKISEEKFRTILRLFCLEMDAKRVSEFTGLNRNTINHIYTRLRKRITELCERESPFSNGEIELDENYFGARRVRGIRGRGARGKIPVFGMLKRGDKVYTQIVKNCSISELIPIIIDKADTDSIIYSDCLKTYDGLVNYGYKKHYRVKHSQNQFANGYNHINGIEKFWSRLSKFRDIHKKAFYLHLKECEFRYNCRNQNLYLILLKELRKNRL